MIEHLEPQGLLDGRRFGFSQVVRTDRPLHVFVAGQTAIDPEGKIVGIDDLGLQTTAALDNLRVALAAAGAGPGDIVALRVYVVGLRPAMFDAITPRLAQFLGDATPPASTWLGVASLLVPNALIEIEAVAALPTDQAVPGPAPAVRVGVEGEV